MKNSIKNYVLNAIDGEGYEKTLATDKGKLQFLYDTFKSEKKWQISQLKSEKLAFENHIGGLPSYFNIDFENHRILEVGKELGLLRKNASEISKDSFLVNWFSIITQFTFELFYQYKVK